MEELVEPDQLQAVAQKLATTIASRSPIAVQRTKYMIRVAQNVPLDAGLLVENDSFAYCMTTEDAAEGQAASVAKSSDGHYWAEALVNGKRVRFLVDTGATAVALTAEDAERLGIRLADLDYTANVTTANGQARAAQVTLASVSVAGARVSDVQALVIDKGLPTSLLGMTYLGRLSRFEATQSALILRP